MVRTGENERVWRMKKCRELTFKGFKILQQREIREHTLFGGRQGPHYQVAYALIDSGKYYICMLKRLLTKTNKTILLYLEKKPRKTPITSHVRGALCSALPPSGRADYYVRSPPKHADLSHFLLAGRILDRFISALAPIAPFSLFATVVNNAQNKNRKTDTKVQGIIYFHLLRVSQRPWRSMSRLSIKN